MKKSLENYNNICIKKSKDEPSASATATSSSTATSTSSSTTQANTLLKQEISSKKNLIFKTKFSSELVTHTHTSTTTQPASSSTFKLKSSKSFQLKPSNLKTSSSVDSLKVFSLKTRSSSEEEEDASDLDESKKLVKHDSLRLPVKENNVNNKSTDSEPDKLMRPLTHKTHQLKFDDSDDDDDDEDLERFKNRIIFKTSTTTTTSTSSNSTQNGAKKTLLIKHKSLDIQMSGGSSSSSSTLTKPIKRKIFNTKRETDLKTFKINSVLNLENIYDDDDVSSKHSDGQNSEDLNEIDEEKTTSETMSASSSKKTSPNSDFKSKNSKLHSNNHQQQQQQQDLLDVQLRNSRKAYECEELGETQAFLDDIFYLMDGLNGKNRLTDRCLCALKLAESCLSSEFRMNLRLSNEYIKRMFSSLGDSPHYQSLALCTSLIMFALNQDKLIMEMDKDTFSLLISILNMKLSEQTTTPPSTATTTNSQASQDQENVDSEIYSKIYERCKDLCKKLIQNKNLLDNNNDTHNQIFISNEEANQLANEYFSVKKRSPNNKKSKTQQQQQQSQDEMITFKKEFNDFNAKLLAIECLLNVNLNKKHNDSADWFKCELRQLGVFDRVIDIIKHTLNVIKQLTLTNHSNSKQQATSNNNNNSNDTNKSRHNEVYYFFVRKYNRYLNFLQSILQTTPTHSSTVLHANHSEPQNKKLKITNSNTATSSNQLNQTYLVQFRDNYLLDLLKESLNHFYEEAMDLSKQTAMLSCEEENSSLECTTRMQLVLASLRENFLLMINLTHNNFNVSSALAGDDKLMKLVFKCISDLTSHVSKEEQFDFLIMSMNILLNIFDTNYQHNTSSKPVKFDFLTVKSFEIILNLYRDKENLVTLAENDQENQLEHLAEQINTENAENINTAIMNSIHNAGKHMEDHLVAAYSALLIGHMLINQSESNLIKIDNVKSKLKDSSFKFMTQIIRKFIIFMKIMNANGFSADDNLNRIINYLENL